MAFRLPETAAERARALIRAKYHPFRSPETDRFGNPPRRKKVVSSS